jgi:hypothetical protein
MMNCEELEARVERLVRGELVPAAEDACRTHAAQCDACNDLLTGTHALLKLRDRAIDAVPPGLSATLVAGSVPRAGTALRETRFWQGAGAGAGLAAALAILMFSWQKPATVVTEPLASKAAEVVVAMDEQRLLDLAIETDKALEDARITIELTGGVELDGYGLQRIIEWNTDLKAGINRLSLPVIAVDPEGGRMVVRLSHPQSEQVFVIRLKTEA